MANNEEKLEKTMNNQISEEPVQKVSDVELVVGIVLATIIIGVVIGTFIMSLV